jgi:hypothetical protein
MWEFIHSVCGGLDCWQWRCRDKSDDVVARSDRFPLFVSCVADARLHGLDLEVHSFRVVQE